MGRHGGHRVFAVLVIALLVAGCGAQQAASEEPDASDEDEPASGAPSATVAEDRHGGTIVVALDSDPPTLNAIVSNANQTFFATKPIFDTLVEYDEELNMVPHLADSFTISDDATVYEFQLVEGVTWHDGEPLTSDDVKFTFEYAIANSSIAKSVFGALESIDTPSDTEVVLTFSAPAATAFALLGDPVMNILPRHIYDVEGEPAENPANLEPVGSGPFKFGEWVRGDHLTLVRNDDYWLEDLPYADEVIFRILPDASQAMTALESGEADYFPYQVPLVDASRLEGSADISFSTNAVAHSTVVAAVNLRVPPLDDIRVREAMSLVADRDRMVEQIALGQGGPARGPISSNSPYFDDSLPELAYDVERANELLDEAGLPRDANGVRFSIRLHHVASVPAFARTAQILKENWDDLGIQTEIIAGELTTTLETVFTNWDFDVAVYSVFAGPEPDRRMNQFYGTDNITGAFFSNAMGYSNPEVDDLIHESTGIVDREERTALYHEIQQLIVADLPAIPLWENPALTAWRNDWQDIFMWADPRFATLARAWEAQP